VFEGVSGLVTTDILCTGGALGYALDLPRPFASPAARVLIFRKLLIITFGTPQVRYFRNPGSLGFQEAIEGSGLESFAGEDAERRWPASTAPVAC
jgi:hypothetical protein